MAEAIDTAQPSDSPTEIDELADPSSAPADTTGTQPDEDDLELPAGTPEWAQKRIKEVTDQRKALKAEKQALQEKLESYKTYDPILAQLNELGIKDEESYQARLAEQQSQVARAQALKEAETDLDKYTQVLREDVETGMLSQERAAELWDQRKEILVTRAEQTRILQHNATVSVKRAKEQAPLIDEDIENLLLGVGKSNPAAVDEVTKLFVRYGQRAAEKAVAEYVSKKDKLTEQTPPLATHQSNSPSPSPRKVEITSDLDALRQKYKQAGLLNT